MRKKVIGVNLKVDLDAYMYEPIVYIWKIVFGKSKQSEQENFW